MITMTNFDNVVGVGSFELHFGGYRIEVQNGTTIGDIAEDFQEMAMYLLENRRGFRHLRKAAEYFGIPESFVEEIWQNAKREYRLYA